ncbi:hypothetical protein AU584_02410 [Salmonella enterica subsp. enterica serovar Agona str. SL483]|uniref:hypothetical protein n=1 Tax=Salmonella enterica TaxID=28901 RepID=UPI0009B0BF2F|nr:hypothetical protein [Salmonella enterica]EBO3327880.1 hypothetical protein [Salmonella enterica subsp. enterica serovar Agona]EDW1357758.1 hypothetical protein [Salmonella enterica subsp. enterica serovar Havana]MIU53258.1 hypothetical protein [Salmonella enterica subsp. enterica serovar Agona str. SL483]
MENQKEQTVTIKIELDTTFTHDEIRDALEYIKRVRQTKAFGKALADLSPFTVKNGEVFFKDAVIGNGLTTDKIRLRECGLSERDVKNASASNSGYEQHTAGGAASVSYTASISINQDKPVQDTVTFTADHFKVHSGIDVNIEALIENAVKNHVQSAVRDIKKQLAADRMTMKDLTSHIKNVMLLECFPDGILHRNFGRR